MIKLISFLSLLITASPTLKEHQQEETPPAHRIQVALLLDTSGSMDGLIEQTKSQLWKMVNELATAQKGGKVPNIEIALYEFGKDTHAATDGYMKQITPLTTDLDLVSEKLFELTTNGGSEYCGWTIQDATNKLEWSKRKGDLKIIIIAGNEEFTQGDVNYIDACKGAVDQYIIVNTIFCGDCDLGVKHKWKDGADKGKGKYICINQENKVVHIETPFDDEILKLNESLNGTYIAYGSKGRALQERQKSQDSNAKGFGNSNMAERTISKSKKMYKNDSWDLVDAEEADDKILDRIKEEELPEEMQKMTEKERKEYISKKSEERKKIQAEINEISIKRKEFITQKRKEMAEEAGGKDNTLDAVMLKAVREQAVSRNFSFEDKK
ncbi:MAG: VWA domain-containing protein [Saprospiraceae bacterium]|nr:VWA domain-containing protein [Saprospiraceae bacterium]